jgi:adenylate kinase
MRLILMGPPGSGKGTQAGWISDHYALQHIATGDMLRSAIAAGGALGNQVKDIVSAGKLVDDATIEQVLRERLRQLPADTGYILDGVPRTMIQLEAVNRVNSELGQKLDCVLLLAVPDEIIVRRITGRRVHPGSGRTYHVEFAPPKDADRDDETGEPLVQRPDDNEETIMERLKVYTRDTEPLLDYYQGLGLLTRIPGAGDVKEVRALLSAHLEKQYA